jgi:hypothetical protein
VRRALQIYTEAETGLRAAPGVFWEKNIAPDAIAV